MSGSRHTRCHLPGTMDKWLSSSPPPLLKAPFTTHHGSRDVPTLRMDKRGRATAAFPTCAPPFINPSAQRLSLPVMLSAASCVAPPGPPQHPPWGQPFTWSPKEEKGHIRCSSERDARPLWQRAGCVLESRGLLLSSTRGGFILLSVFPSQQVTGSHCHRDTTRGISKPV